MPRFSANITFLFKELPLIERFAAAKKAGFGAVEIAFPYDAPVAELKAAKEHAGLDMTVINVPAGDMMKGGPGNAAVPGREDEFKRAVEEALPYAKALKPGAVNVLAGAPPSDQFPRERCLDVLAKNAAYAADAFGAVGARTVLEAVNTRDRPGFLLSHTRDSRDVVRRSGHPTLGIEFDIYHMYVMGEDLVRGVADNMEMIGNIQFADDPGRHEPGTGTIDFARVFAGIDRAGWRGYMAAEYMPSGRTEDTLGWMRAYASN